MKTLLVTALLVSVAALVPGVGEAKGKAKKCKGKLSERTVSGVYVSAACGDYCYTTFKVDGKEETFMSDELSEDSVGKTFKLKIVKTDMMIPEAGGCNVVELVGAVTPEK